jgi:DNA-binding NtrC family response regulator
MQVKLLRLLETGTYRRVGSTELIRADIRLISATHQPLKALVAQGRFRQDLFYRVNAFPICLPALRERPDDIPLLAGRSAASPPSASSSSPTTRWPACRPTTTRATCASCATSWNGRA